MATSKDSRLTPLEARVAATALRLILRDPDFFQEGLFSANEGRALSRAEKKLREIAE
jgi:hypothetical protein